MEALDIVSALTAEFQSVQATVADLGVRFGSIIAATVLIFGLSLRMATGGGGASGYVVGWIVNTGLVLGAISFSPLLADAAFDTASALVAMTTGGDLSALDVARRGFDFYSRLIAHAESGGIWDMLTSLGTFMLLNVAALIVLAAHLWVSIVLALSILQFWAGAAILPLTMAFMFVPGLQGIGGQSIGWLIAGMLRLTFLGVIMGLGRETFLGIAIPDLGESITWEQVVGATFASFVVAALAWAASNWASQITRGSIGNTGAASMFATMAGVSGAAARGGVGSVGSTAVSGTAAGASSAGTAGAAGARAAGARAAGGGGAASAGSAGGRVGRQTAP